MWVVLAVCCPVGAYRVIVWHRPTNIDRAIIKYWFKVVFVNTKFPTTFSMSSTLCSIYDEYFNNDVGFHLIFSLKCVGILNVIKAVLWINQRLLGHESRGFLITIPLAWQGNDIPVTWYLTNFRNNITSCFRFYIQIRFLPLNIHTIILLKYLHPSKHIIITSSQISFRCHHAVMLSM